VNGRYKPGDRLHGVEGGHRSAIPPTQAVVGEPAGAAQGAAVGPHRDEAEVGVVSRIATRLFLAPPAKLTRGRQKLERTRQRHRRRAQGPDDTSDRADHQARLVERDVVLAPRGDHVLGVGQERGHVVLGRPKGTLQTRSHDRRADPEPVGSAISGRRSGPPVSRGSAA
jgi:hypothetical protein